MLQSSYFWLGLAIGLMGGSTLGALMMAVMAMAKDSNFYPPGPDEPHLACDDAPLVPGERKYSSYVGMDGRFRR